MSKKRWIIFLICIFAVAAAVCYIVYYFAVKDHNENVYEQIQSTVVTPIEEPEEEPEEEEPVEQPVEEEPPVEIPIDFEALWAINPDVYAWIEIPGTEIAYPILQHPTDDSYYLDHTIEGVEGYPGSLYTESCDAKDFSDFNTVIYGHNMKDRSMFGSLKDYRDSDFLSEHREIIIYTPTEKRVYQVFAAVVYDDRYIPAVYDDSDPEDRQAFLDSISETRDLNSQVLDDVDVNTDSQILTLSTCIGSQPNNRYLIEAVYVGEE